MSEKTSSPAILSDIQNSADSRRIPIDRVGVRGITYPIVVLDQAKELQHTIGTFTLTVDLPHHFKGTHMSRFLEGLNAHEGEISVRSIPVLLADLRERLHSHRSHLTVDFLYFRSKAAPVTQREGLMSYDCRFEAMGGEETDFVLQVIVPVTTLCPCSKEISAYGAHNQRGYVTVRARMNDHVWIEELIDWVEGAASAPLYPVLKRPDEKFVTEQAYDNPRFVEDMVREIAIRLDAVERIDWYSVEVENHESIHAHNAYAFIERQRTQA